MKSLYRAMGICAIIFGLLEILSHVILVGSVGFSFPGAQTVQEIKEIYGQTGTYVSLAMLTLAYMLVLPAITGLVIRIYLKDEKKYAVVGYVFGFICYFLLLVAALLQLGGSRLLAGHERMLFDPEQALAILSTISQLLFLPALLLALLYYLITGLALLASKGLYRLGGYLFLVQVALAILCFLFYSIQSRFLTDLFTHLQVLVVAGAFIVVGLGMYSEKE